MDWRTLRVLYPQITVLMQNCLKDFESPVPRRNVPTGHVCEESLD
jgi:hypothetical protein